MNGNSVYFRGTVAGAAGCRSRVLLPGFLAGSWAESPWPESKARNECLIRPLESLLLLDLICRSVLMFLFMCGYIPAVNGVSITSYSYPETQILTWWKVLLHDPPKFFLTNTPMCSNSDRSSAWREFGWCGHLFETLLKILEMKKLCLHIIPSKENCQKNSECI